MGKTIFLRLLAVSVAVIAVLLSTAVSYANIKINIVAANASTEEKKQVPVKYYLPKELAPDDIVDFGGLKSDYDLDKAQYYVSGTLELAPKESKTVTLDVKDVWKISQEEIDILKSQISENLTLLEKSPYYESAQVLRDNMFKKLDYILTQQSNYSDNIERRIEEYRAYVDELDEIRKNAFSVEYLKSPVSAEKEKTVKFIIEVKNPLAKDSKIFKQQHYLPAEVHTEDVIDAQGFDVRFDEQKKQSYLTKEEKFAPAETKRYEIVIRDIWSIDPEKITSFKDRAEKAMEGIKGSDYEKNADYIFNQINTSLGKIENLQQQRDDIKKYIGASRINKERLVKAEVEIIKLEMMLATVKAKKLEEFEKSKVKNVLQKLKALRGISALSQAIFGKKPSINTTWRIIWGVMVFVAVFTTIHFFTWWRKSQVMGEELAIKAGGITPVTEVKEKEGEEKA